MKTASSILAIALGCVAAPAMSQHLKLEESTTTASAPGRADVARTVRADATVAAGPVGDQVQVTCTEAVAISVESKSK